jgi:hypothetical protein
MDNIWYTGSRLTPVYSALLLNSSGVLNAKYSLPTFGEGDWFELASQKGVFEYSQWSRAVFQVSSRNLSNIASLGYGERMKACCVLCVCQWVVDALWMSDSMRITVVIFVAVVGVCSWVRVEEAVEREERHLLQTRHRNWRARSCSEWLLL